VIDTATNRVTFSEPMRPDVFGSPRPLGQWLDINEWNARTTEHTYVLEVIGQPVIFGAKLRVGYAGGQ
jgi:hypothetical protein